MTKPASPHVLYLQQHPAGRAAVADEFEALFDLCQGITPVVEALPPDAALLDVGGAVRYFGRSPAHLATRLRVRALAQIGTDITVGIATNPLLARIAAHTSPRGAVRILPDQQVPAVLGPLPVTALRGAGPATSTGCSPTPPPVPPGTSRRHPRWPRSWPGCDCRAGRRYATRAWNAARSWPPSSPPTPTTCAP